MLNTPLRTQTSVTHTPKQQTLRDLFRKRQNLINLGKLLLFHPLGVLIVLWSFTSFSSYMIVYYLKYLPGDFYANNASAGIA